MATDFDPYAILQVEPSARQDEIDEAYRRQWAAYPSNPSPELRLRELQAAYRVLSDPEERRAYDGRLAERAIDGHSPGATAMAAPKARAAIPWGPKQILQSIGIIIGAVILVSIPVFLIADAVAGSRDINDDPNSLAIQFIASAFFQVAAFGTAWWFSIRKYGLSWGALGLRMPERGLPWLPFTLAALAIVIVGIYGFFLDTVGVHPDTELPDAAYTNALPLIIILTLTVFVAPVVEETFFRGFVFRGLAGRWGTVWGAIGSATLFGAAHLGNSGYFYVVPPIIIIGIMFAWSYHYSRSILPSIGAHFLFNLIQMTAILLTR